jgi:TonB family protein
MNCMNCGNALSEGVRFCPRCGSPAAQPAPHTPPPAEPLRTSWDAGGAAAPPRRKSRAGKILLILFGLLLVIGAGVGVAVYFGVRYVADTVKSSEPYQLAERELRQSQAAADALGDIKSTGFPVGNFNTQAGGTGNAAFTMSVEGTKASGRYVVALTREGGSWSITSAVLRMDNGEVIVVAGDEMDTGGTGVGTGDPADAPPPPPAPPAGKQDPVKVQGAVSVGALDAKATSKPEPTYPAIAKAARASGKVVVQVTVDESGQVILASAVSGHPLLQPAAVAAARRARFAPTLTTGKKPVNTIGTLTYVFEPPTP